MRKIDSCMNCGDSREIVSRGLCAKCYMRNVRAEDSKDTPFGPDRSQNKSQRELNRMRVNFSKIIALLDETPTSNIVLSPGNHEAIKTILIAAVDRINALQGPQQELTSETDSEEAEAEEIEESDEEQGEDHTIGTES